jgi:hypothetical protein
LATGVEHTKLKALAKEILFSRIEALFAFEHPGAGVGYRFLFLWRSRRLMLSTTIPSASTPEQYLKK